MKRHTLFGFACVFLSAAVARSQAAHTVLVEGVSTSGCPHCAGATNAMYALYSSGVYDVLYLGYVSDRNPAVGGRVSELGVSAVPHYFFDGGFENWIGAGELPDAYVQRIEACAGRTVPDLDVTVRGVWEADAYVAITATVTNRTETAYEGRLRVCLFERVSRWKTTANEPFHCAMIGPFVLDMDIALSAGETSQAQGQWDGLIFGFLDVVRENLAVLAFVVDGGSGYVDAAVEAPVVGIAPLFMRGDANADGAMNIADAIFLLTHLFAGGDVPPCRDAADANADGALDIADAVAILSHLFAGAGPLPEPFDVCGVSPTPSALDCISFPPCE